MRPLRALPLSAQVPLSDLPDKGPVSVSANYAAVRLATNFLYGPAITGAIDTPVLGPVIEVAITEVAADGSFTLQVPDLWNDPSVAALPGVPRPSLGFFLRAPGLGATLQTPLVMGFPIAPSYDQVLLLSRHREGRSWTENVRLPIDDSARRLRRSPLTISRALILTALTVLPCTSTGDARK